MKDRVAHVVLLVVLLCIAGCATTRAVTLSQAVPTGSIDTIAQIPEAGNSPAMDANLREALLLAGVTPKPNLPTGTRRSSDVDAIIAYSDTWRWGLGMYLERLNIYIFDAQTGALMVTGRWEDSALHGWRDERAVVQNLVVAMIARLRSRPPAR